MEQSGACHSQGAGPWLCAIWGKTTCSFSYLCVLCWEDEGAHPKIRKMAEIRWDCQNDYTMVALT